MIPIKNRTTAELVSAITQLIHTVPVRSIRGDGEKGFNTPELQQLFRTNEIKTYFTSQRFINKNRVIDRVIRTIRDGFGMRSTDMRNNNKMQEMVQLYNNSPHMSYNNLFTPTEIQENQEIEGSFIANKQRELRQALHSQK